MNNKRAYAPESDLDRLESPPNLRATLGRVSPAQRLSPKSRALVKTYPIFVQSLEQDEALWELEGKIRQPFRYT